MRARRIFLIVGTLLFALYATLLILNLTGYAYPVEGVSMQPILRYGYMAFVEPATISQLVPNSTIIVYYNPFYRELVIHMVISKIDDYAVIVKGVNPITNPYPDLNYTSGTPLLVTQNMIRGKVVFWVPYLGFLVLRPYNYVISLIFVVAVLINALDTKRAH